MEFSVSRQFQWQGPPGVNSLRLMRMFGVDRRRLEEQTEEHTCRLRLEPGQICLITGPSGSGKSVLLKAMFDACEPEKRLRLEAIPLDGTRALIDCIDGEFTASLRMLCRAGLGDVFTLLQRPSRLSGGQQYRYRLARVILSDRPFIFADEFGCILDRACAKITAFQIRQIAWETGKSFVLACAHDDLLRDLRPDLVVVKGINHQTAIYGPSEISCNKKPP